MPRFPELQLELPRWRLRKKRQSRLSTMFIRKVFGRNSVSCFIFLARRMSERLLPGDAVVINPEISSGIPLAGIYRWPQPGSRPERYSSPATKGRMSRLTIGPAHPFSCQLPTPLKIRTGREMFGGHIPNFLWSRSLTYRHFSSNTLKPRRMPPYPLRGSSH
jgi:hypothetical protein